MKIIINKEIEIKLKANRKFDFYSEGLHICFDENGLSYNSDNPVDQVLMQGKQELMPGRPLIELTAELIMRKKKYADLIPVADTQLKENSLGGYEIHKSAIEYDKSDRFNHVFGKLPDVSPEIGGVNND